MTAARLTVGEVAGEQPALLDPERPQRALALSGDHALDSIAAAPGNELLVFLAQLAPGPEQGALDDRLGHPQALADLGVGAALELAHDDDPVMAVGEPLERAAEVVQTLLVLDRRIGPMGDQPGGCDTDAVAVAMTAASRGTSWLRRARRNSSMQAFLAIS